MSTIRELSIASVLVLFFLPFLVGCPGQVKGTFFNTASSSLFEKFYVEASKNQLVEGQEVELIAHNEQGEVTYSIIQGQGLINSEAKYESQGFTGVVVIEAKDGAGNKTYVSLNVVEKIRAKLESQQMMVGTLNAIVVNGGLQPYKFKALSGAIQIDDNGLIISGMQAGNASIEVTDALQQTIQLNLPILPKLQFANTSFSVLAGQGLIIQAQGGVGTIKYSLSGLGQLDMSSGYFLASQTQGVSFLRATDEQGNTAFTMVKTEAASGLGQISVTPSAVQISVNQKQRFSVANGVPPYRLVKVSGVGEAVAEELEFVANVQGIAVLKIVDSQDNESAPLNVTVIPSLMINVGLGQTPDSVVLRPGGTLNISPVGGVEPFTFVPSLGSIEVAADGKTAIYTSPDYSGVDVISVTDGSGHTERIYVKIWQALTIAPNPVNLAKEGVLQFIAMGGREPYTFAVAEGSGNVIEDSGYFGASGTAGTAKIRVTDSEGETDTALVNVYDSLSISPFYKVSIVNRVETLEFSGGVGPFNFSVDQGFLCESNNSCTQKSLVVATTGQVKVKMPAAASEVRLVLRDSQNGESSVTFKANNELSFAVDQNILTPQEKAIFQLQGGIPPYRLKETPSSGSVSQLNSQKFEFTVPSLISVATSVAVQFVDSEGTTVESILQLFPTLSISATDLVILKGQTALLSIAGGDGRYTIEKLSGPGALDSINNVTNQVVFNADISELGLTLIQVSDGGADKIHKAQITIRTTELATAVLSGTPPSQSNASQLNVTVGGDNIVEYRYALLLQPNLCSLANYGQTISVANAIVGPIGGDGAYTLCVLGKTQSGVWQDLNLATAHNWLQDSTAPTVSISANGLVSPTNQANLLMSATFNEDVTGFTSADVQLVNGTISNFTSINAREYTFSVTASGEGETSVKVAAGVANDLAGNQNLLSNTLAFVYDITAPQSPSIAFSPSTEFTNSLSQTVSLAASGATLMLVSQDSSCSSGQFEALQSTKAISLSNAEGLKFVSAKFRDAAGNESACVSASITLDLTPPSTTVASGANWGSGTTSPQYSWTAATDQLSGILGYEYSLGNVSGAPDIKDWTAVSATSTQASGLTLVEGNTYYFNLRVKDKAGNYSAATVNSFGVDSQAPLAGTLTLPNLFNSIASSPLLSWNGFSDGGSGLDVYELAVGSTALATDVKDWTDVGLASSTSLSFSPNLTDGNSYYVSIRARDKAGNYSSIVPGANEWIVQVDVTPNSFTFTDNAGAPANSVITSNLVQVSGFAGPLTATVAGAGSPQISKDGSTWSSSVSVVSGESIAIRLTSSTTPLESRTATVTLGTYTSPSWTVTTEIPQDPPTIATVSPNYGSSAGGTSITITGTYFYSGAGFNVQVGSSNCTSINVSSLTSLTCVTPAGTAGIAKVKVTTANGKSVEKGDGFTFVGTPATYASVANSGPNGGFDNQTAQAVWTGNVMLYMGGYQSYDATYRSEVRSFDPITNAYTNLANMPGGGVGFNSFWDGKRVIVFGGSSNLNSCADRATLAWYSPVTNTWTSSAVTTNRPSIRNNAAGGWDGRRLYVWGGQYRVSGCATIGYPTDGGIYDSETDTWEVLPNPNSLSGRVDTFSITTNRKFIIWGGRAGSPSYNDGRVYDLVDKTWTNMTTNGAPSPRGSYGAWATRLGMKYENKLMVMGGSASGGNATDGGIYDPATDTWTYLDLTAIGSPAIIAARGIWTGAMMFICLQSTPTVPCQFYDPKKHIFMSVGPSGFGSSYEYLYIKNNKIGLMNYWKANSNKYFTISSAAAGNTWSSSSTVNAPSARKNAIVNWSGSKMIVYGGTSADASILNSGALYDPFTDSWSPMPSGPTVTSNTSVSDLVFDKMYVFNSNVNSGAYDVNLNTWGALPASPFAGEGAGSSVWNGDKWLVYSEAQNAGAVFNPRTATWASMNSGSNPANVDPQAKGSFVWTGTQALYFGGRRNGTVSNELNSYSVATNSWSLKTSGLAAKEKFAFGWSGSQLLVWGGSDGSTAVNTGYLYTETSNAWSTMTSGTAPVARLNPKGLWANKKFLVWGGDARNDGALYDPVGNSWSSYAASTCIGRNDASMGFTGFVGGLNSTIRQYNNPTGGDVGKLFFFGGTDSVGNYLNSGCIYNLPD